MSDLSLLNGVYANVEAYAELIDKVIYGLQQPASSQTQKDRLKLGALLIDAADRGVTKRSVEALMLESLLRSETGQQRVDLKRLGNQLVAGVLDRGSRRQLESLAEDLERERAGVATRLRGR
jgi:hypothetical protein